MTLQLALERINTLETVQDGLQTRIGELLRENTKLRVEVEGLRPPVPKFKTGQIVRRGTVYRKVRSVESRLLDKKIWYTLAPTDSGFSADWAWETDLVGLTKEEKGPEEARWEENSL